MFGCLDLHVAFDGDPAKLFLSLALYSIMFQYSSLVLILATDALRPLRSQSCSVVCYKATDPQLKDQFAEVLLALPHVFLFRFCPSSTSQPNGFSCDVVSSLRVFWSLYARVRQRSQ